MIFLSDAQLKDQVYSTWIIVLPFSLILMIGSSIVLWWLPQEYHNSEHTG